MGTINQNKFPVPTEMREKLGTTRIDRFRHLRVPWEWDEDRWTTLRLSDKRRVTWKFLGAATSARLSHQIWSLPSIVYTTIQMHSIHWYQMIVSGLRVSSNRSLISRSQSHEQESVSKMLVCYWLPLRIRNDWIYRRCEQVASQRMNFL